MSITAKPQPIFGPRAKYLVGVWGVPIAMVIVAFAVMPDPGRAKESYPSATFIPKEIAIHQGHGRKGSDHWDLLIHHPDGQSFQLRNPESSPIEQVHERIPKDVALRLTYEPGSDANLLLAIERADGTGEPILSYESVMAEYAQRRSVILAVAALWFLVGNLLVWGIRRVTTRRDHVDQV